MTAITRDQVVLATVAEFLRARGIPCGVWRVPGPDDIDEAQRAFDRECERMIDDMLTDVPARLVEMERQNAELQAMIDRGEMPF